MVFTSCFVTGTSCTGATARSRHLHFPHDRPLASVSHLLAFSLSRLAPALRSASEATNGGEPSRCCRRSVTEASRCVASSADGPSSLLQNTFCFRSPAHYSVALSASAKGQLWREAMPLLCFCNRDQSEHAVRLCQTRRCNCCTRHMRQALGLSGFPVRTIRGLIASGISLNLEAQTHNHNNHWQDGLVCSPMSSPMPLPSAPVSEEPTSASAPALPGSSSRSFLPELPPGLRRSLAASLAAHERDAGAQGWAQGCAQGFAEGWRWGEARNIKPNVIACNSLISALSWDRRQQFQGSESLTYLFDRYVVFLFNEKLAKQVSAVNLYPTHQTLHALLNLLHPLPSMHSHPTGEYELQ